MKKQNLTTYIGIAAGIIAIAIVKQFLFSTPSFDKELVKFANEFNKTCPLIVDQETQLDNVVTLPDRTIQYNYSLINYTKDELDSVYFVETLRPSILNMIKTNPDLETFRTNDVNMFYCYKDKDGVFITKFEFKPSEYNQ